MDDIVLARAIHVLAVVVWIGGVAMVTTVVLPALRAGRLGPDRQSAFRAIEHRFVWQARIGVMLVGLTGFYMVAALNLWDRFESASFWWMHAMVAVWLLFALVLFIAEPFILRRRSERRCEESPQAAFARLHRTHWALLFLSLVTVFGAVAGSHGWRLFSM